MKKTSILNVTIPKLLKEKVLEECEEKGISQGAVTSIALSEHFKKKEEKKSE